MAKKEVPPAMYTGDVNRQAGPVTVRLQILEIAGVGQAQADLPMVRAKVSIAFGYVAQGVVPQAGHFTVYLAVFGRQRVEEAIAAKKDVHIAARFSGIDHGRKAPVVINADAEVGSPGHCLRPDHVSGTRMAQPGDIERWVVESICY
jgi:hypothetical protein